MMNLPLEQLPEWQRDIRQRNILDLSDWFEEGQAALEREDIQHKFAEISDRCYRKLQDAERLKNIRSTIPPFFKELLWRTTLIKQIRDSLDKSEYPVTGLFGLPGMGKSTVAFSYAKEFQSRYPGGCWYIPASGSLNFREKLIQIAGLDWEIQFNEAEKKDTERAWLRVKHFLEDPLQQNEKHLTLLIFDNVDSPEESFSDAEVDKNLLNGTHILITSRRQVNNCRRSKWIPVEGLPDDESMDMLNGYRAFNSEEEKSAAASIVKELNGFALALTIIGVQVSSNLNTSFKDVIEDLKSGNVSFLDYTGNQLKDLPGHYEQKVMTRLFAPLLEGLAEHELHVLDYAALMPPDSVALPWLEELVAEEFPDSFPAPKFKSELSAWEMLVRKFKGMSLFSDTPSANVARIHRLLQEVITQNRQVQQQEIENNLQELVVNKAELLVNNIHVKSTKWQVPVLRAFASHNSIENTTKAIFLNFLSLIEIELGNYPAARERMEQAIDIGEKNYDLNHTQLGIYYSNIAATEQHIGSYNVAKEWLKKAIAIAKKNYGPIHSELGNYYLGMARIEENLGNYNVAKDWIVKAIAIAEKNYAPNHPEFGNYYFVAALIEQALGNYEIANNNMKKAVDIAEKIFEPNHPELGTRYRGVASIEQDLGNHAAAKAWMEKAIDIAEKSYDPNHPVLGAYYLTIGRIERDLNNHAIAMVWMKKAIDIYEKNYESGHPELAALYLNTATVEKGLGKFVIAKEWTKRAITIAEKNYDFNHPELANYYSAMAQIERDLGNYTAAKDWIKKAIDIAEKNYDPNHPELGNYYLGMAIIEKDLGNYTVAKDWIKKAIDIAEKNYDPTHPELGNYYHNLAAIELDTGDRQRACKLWLKTYWILFNSLGEGHPNTKSVLWDLKTHCPECFK